MDSFLEDSHVHRARSWIATIVTLLVLGLVGMFVWRVLFFADLIRSGELDLSGQDFLSNYTASAALASEPLSQGEFNVTSTDDPSLGTRGAPVTIVEFADFQCPSSRESSFILRELAAAYPDKIDYIYRDFPLSEIHPLAQKAAEAGECAHAQGKFWEYHDRIYQNQAALAEDSFVEFARELNLNVAAFESCFSGNRMGKEVLADYEAGVAAGVRGTPTFFINGNRIPGAIPKDILESIVESIITAQGS